MQNWTPEEEQALYDYVQSHFRSDDSIDWSELQRFVQRATPQCKTKYYRMINDGKWQFRKTVARPQAKKHASHREIIADRQALEQLLHVFSSYQPNTLQTQQ